MLLSPQKKQKTQKNKQTNKLSNKPTTMKHTKTAATYGIPCLHHRWRCYLEIALNDNRQGLHLLPYCHHSYMMPNSNANSVSTPRRWSLD